MCPVSKWQIQLVEICAGCFFCLHYNPVLQDNVVSSCIKDSQMISVPEMVILLGNFYNNGDRQTIHMAIRSFMESTSSIQWCRFATCLMS